LGRGAVTGAVYCTRFFGMVQISSVGFLPLSIWTSFSGLGHLHNQIATVGLRMLDRVSWRETRRKQKDDADD
jgi:hypothetical protein